MPDQAQAAKILNIYTYPLSEGDLRLCGGARVSISIQYAGPPAAFKSSMDSRARAKQLQKNPIIEWVAERFSYPPARQQRLSRLWRSVDILSNQRSRSSIYVIADVVILTVPKICVTVDLIGRFCEILKDRPILSIRPNPTRTIEWPSHQCASAAFSKGHFSTKDLIP